MKANPENAAKAMTETLHNEDNERVFQQSDFLTPHQVASYFSRMSNLSPFNDEWRELGEIASDLLKTWVKMTS